MTPTCSRLRHIRGSATRRAASPGIQSLADVNVALHDDRERSGRAGDNTKFGVQLFAVANVTLHDALRETVRATCQHDIGVQFFADVNDTLHDARLHEPG